MPLSTPATPASPSPSSALLSPPLLYAHGLALFRTIFSLVFTLFNSLVRFYSAHPEHDSLRTLTLALECLTAFLSLEYTLHCAPERITPRQLLRLSKAARALSRLTGQTFDFSPWTSLSSEELSNLDRLYPSPVNPYAEWRPRPYELRLPSGGNSCTSLLLYPGATLANVIKKLARILPPDFTGSADVPSTHASADPSAPASPESPAPALSPSPASSQSIPSIPSTQSIASQASHPSHPSSPSHLSHSSHSSSAVLLADPALSPALKSQISNPQSSFSPSPLLHPVSPSPCPPAAPSSSPHSAFHNPHSPRPPG